MSVRAARDVAAACDAPSRSRSTRVSCVATAFSLYSIYTLFYLHRLVVLSVLVLRVTVSSVKKTFTDLLTLRRNPHLCEYRQLENSHKVEFRFSNIISYKEKRLAVSKYA